MTNKLIEKCPICNGWLTNVTSGSICLNGCSEMYPKVSNIVHQRSVGVNIPEASVVAAFMLAKAELSFSIAKTALFRLEGQPGLWANVPRTGVGLQAGEGHQIAVIGGESIREFRRLEDLEAILTDLMSDEIPEAFDLDDSDGAEAERDTDDDAAEAAEAADTELSDKTPTEQESEIADADAAADAADGPMRSEDFDQALSK